MFKACQIRNGVFKILPLNSYPFYISINNFKLLFDSLNYLIFSGPETNVCYDVVDQKCKNDLHYSKTYVPTQLQTAEDTVFKPIIDSSCSAELEKFICYTQFPPCYPNRPSVTSMPCKSLCDTVNKKCWKQFINSGLPLPHCDYIYPREDNATGLCEVKKWPALWPQKFRPPPPRKYGTMYNLQLDLY